MKIIIMSLLASSCLFANILSFDKDYEKKNNTSDNRKRMEIKRMMKETTLPVKKIYKKYNKNSKIFIEDFRHNNRENRIYTLFSNNKILGNNKELDFNKKIQTFRFNDNNEFFFIEKNKFYISKVGPGRSIVNKTNIEKKLNKEIIFSYSGTEIQDMVFQDRKGFKNFFYVLHTDFRSNYSYISLINSNGDIISNQKINVKNASSLYIEGNEFLVTTKFENKMYKLDLDGTIKGEYILPFTNIKDMIKIDDELYFSVDNNYYIFKLKEEILGLSKEFNNGIEIKQEDVTNNYVRDNELSGSIKQIEKMIINEDNIKNNVIKKPKPKKPVPEIKENEIDYELDLKINEYKLDTDMDYDEIFQKK